MKTLCYGIVLGLCVLLLVGCFRLNAAGEVELTEFGERYGESLLQQRSTICTSSCGQRRCASICRSY